MNLILVSYILISLMFLIKRDQETVSSISLIVIQLIVLQLMNFLIPNMPQYILYIMILMFVILNTIIELKKVNNN